LADQFISIPLGLFLLLGYRVKGRKVKPAEGKSEVDGIKLGLKTIKCWKGYQAGFLKVYYRFYII
jgi:hypothetical protein